MTRDDAGDYGFDYLASPYSARSKYMRQVRYELAVAATANLLDKGIIVYSPIVHNHTLALHHNFPKDFSFWSKHDLHMLARARAIRILCIPGWDISVGVNAEREFADLHGIPEILQYHI